MDGNTVYSAKIAIPRLKRTDQHQTASSSKPPRVRSETVNKACTRCRKRKTKCSGTRPRCTNCEKQGDVCVYEQPRRDRLRDALNKNDVLITLLHELRGVISEGHAKMIDDVLQQFEDDTPPSTPSLFTRSTEEQRRSPSGDIDYDGTQAADDAHMSASIDPNEETDLLDEDLLPGPSETGYLGRNSQVQWMRTLQLKLDQAEGKFSHLPHAPSGGSDEAIAKRADASHLHQAQSLSSRPLKDYYFYLDKDPVDNLKTVHTNIVPSAETAERLFNIYQSAVGTPFRILDDQFGEQLREYYELVQRGGALTVCPKWKAIMNLVFAIGARFSQLVGADWQAEDCDHSVYMARAVHFLELEKITTLVCAPDKSLIHATGLLSFYYLTIGHVSRAWYMIGVSLRHAQAAGFHLKNEDVSITLEQKRAVAQTWWALHSIECVLTSITGRPRVICRNDCTVPLLAQLTEAGSRKNTPILPMSKLQSKSMQSMPPSTSGHRRASRGPTAASSDRDTFLNAWSKLDIIQHKTLTNLYSVRDAAYSWKRMPKEISSLIKELSEWAEEAIANGLFEIPGTEQSNQRREKSLLYFQHQSVKIYMTRPCLCRLDQRIKGQSAESVRFNQDTADACVQAALDLTSWLPDLSNPRWIYENGPWWSSVHIIMQAITVLLLELAQGTSYLSEDTPHVTACMEKLVQWLNTMRIVDGVAENAHKIVCDMLSKHEQFVRKISPGSWLLETFVAVPNTFSNMPSQLQTNPDPQLSTYSFNDNLYTAANQGSFDLDTLTDPLNDPFGNIQFGQAQYPLFYGNQFATFFDQDMSYDFEDPVNLEDANISGILGQEPPPPL